MEAAGVIEPALVPERRMTPMEEWLLDRSVDVVGRLAREMGLSRAEALALVADRLVEKGLDRPQIDAASAS
jgi:hypothetical protein